ncbi:MAG TPA: hypothetical protein VMT19_00605 [Thermoanaerobaculaceae bacterium]|nr:hypothetical protein [Thermoanaerobaculaceae bacterium]
MANKHVALRVARLAIGRNGRTGRREVANRFVFQILHPTRHDDNPAASFAVGSGEGPVPPAELDAALPDALVFKGQAFTQAFDEPLRIRVHHFQDVTRDWLQVAVGTVFSSVLDSFLGKVSLVSVTLTDLIDPGQSLRLGDDTFAQKLGYAELVIDPTAARPSPVQAISAKLVAPADALGFAPLGPQGEPKRVSVVAQGQVTATMDLELRLS